MSRALAVLWLLAGLLLPLAVYGDADTEALLAHALKPVSRFGMPGWMELHVQYTEAIDAAKAEVGT
jgi:hypothetical protein